MLNNTIFQSTLPHGSDIEGYCDGFTRPISIHAPSRERVIALIYAVVAAVFQSTLPHGSDVTRTPEMVAAEMFQSTLPYGSDVFIKRQLHIFCISIHAPLRERPMPARKYRIKCRFQSTLPRGSDQL